MVVEITLGITGGEVNVKGGEANVRGGERKEKFELGLKCRFRLLTLGQEIGFIATLPWEIFGSLLLHLSPI